MIYLTTGANGAGKTLLTLRDVREKSLKENRPVYHNGRFEIVPGGELSTWTTFETKDWQTVPDGAIFVIDECHNPGDFPLRTVKDAIPDYVKAMAEHRRRGFDFYLITQHPMNIDPFVRRLIGSPGWHRHLKRASGAPLVSVLEWPAVNEQPQKNGSGLSAAVSMVTYPREVYKWYVSTSLNTAKLKIPFQAKLLVFSLLLFPVLGYYGYKNMADRSKPKEALSVVNGFQSPPIGGQNDVKKQLSAPEFVATFAPRLDGFPQTAPRYDDVTKPTVAPYPAACVSMGARCDCYTQQATKLQVPSSICLQIVKGGFFNDWQATPAGSPSARAEPLTGGNLPDYKPTPDRVAAASVVAMDAEVRRFTQSHRVPPL
jgi:zona occludens toxin